MSDGLVQVRMRLDGDHLRDAGPHSRRVSGGLLKVRMRLQDQESISVMRDLKACARVTYDVDGLVQVRMRLDRESMAPPWCGTSRRASDGLVQVRMRLQDQETISVM